MPSAFSLVVTATLVAVGVSPAPVTRLQPASTTAGPATRIDLGERLAAKALRGVNRQVTSSDEGVGGVHMNAAPGVGVAWIEGTEFAEGTIEIDVRGKDVPQQSFVGVAFRRRDDTTYEAVYLRPFNFRAEDPVRHRHAVQYVSMPDFDWPRLRKEFPDEFESSVDRSLAPTGWIPVRLVVSAKRIQVYVGALSTAALDVRRLGTVERGMIGLWVGNGSDGEFANLRVTPSNR
jgi:hypothetical protein